MKTLVGIEVITYKDKETKVEKTNTKLHFLEDAGDGGENVTGQRVSSEILWGMSGISKEIRVVGDLKIGCHATVYYEGEGNFKKPTLIMCEK